jgi:hypothetical protein
MGNGIVHNSRLAWYSHPHQPQFVVLGVYPVSPKDLDLGTTNDTQQAPNVFVDRRSTNGVPDSHTPITTTVNTVRAPPSLLGLQYSTDDLKIL